MFKLFLFVIPFFHTMAVKAQEIDKRLQEKGIVLTKRSQIVVCRTDVLEEMRGQASD